MSSALPPQREDGEAQLCAEKMELLMVEGVQSGASLNRIGSGVLELDRLLSIKARHEHSKMYGDVAVSSGL
jgi:hypothetical protein